MTTGEFPTRAGSRAVAFYRRLILIVGMMAVAVVGFVTPAAADTVWGSAGAVETQLLCTPGSIVISPFVSVQNGYQNGQAVTYRYHLTNNRGYAGTSGWSSPSNIPFSTYSWNRTTIYGTTMLPQARVPAVAGTLWQVLVQVGYWNPNARAYSYTGWYQPTDVNTMTGRYVYRAAHASCLT